MAWNDVVMKIIFPFLGGLGMFLFGMKLMSDNLEKIAGNKLRKMLDIITKNKFVGMAVGGIFTMLVQSSSATTVMVVGFVNAGLMNLVQATSVIMGANIGTTITAQLVAFNLKEIAPIILFVGVFFVFFIKRQKIRTSGMVLVGFGLLFLGMGAMSSAMKPLRAMEGFTQILTSFGNPFLGVMSGAFLTAVIQSSSASMAILLAMAGEGLIDLQGSLFIILGFNIGTCITALLACIGANKTAQRAAIVHLAFNLVGSLLFILLVQVLPIADWVQALGGDNRRQLANFHTIFNIAMTAILLPASAGLVWVSKRIISGEDLPKEPRKLMYIEDHMFATPIILVTQVGKEVERMAQLARQNIEAAVDGFINSNKETVDMVYDKEEVIDFLNHEITDALVKVNHYDLSKEDSDYVSHMFHIVNDLERIGDHAENIAEFADQRIDRQLKISDTAIDELQTFKGKVLKILDMSLVALNGYDGEPDIQGVLDLEDDIDKMEGKLRKRHIKRLKKKECNARAGTIFIDILSNLERVSDHATNIATSDFDE